MRYLLPFALGAIAVLSFAGCAGPLITEPAKGYRLADAGGPNCGRFAKPGDTKIQIYCISTGRPARAQPVSDVPSNCRLLLPENGEKVESSCGDAAHWDEYDVLAVSAGVTCRWRWRAAGPTAKPQWQEVCLTAGVWTELTDSERRVARSSRRSGSPGPAFGSGWGGNNTSGSQAPYATSFGAFPAGGAVGQSFH